MNFGRQLQPVMVTIEGGEQVDREYWLGRLRAYLEHQPCVTNVVGVGEKSMFAIHPDANND